MHIHKRFSNHGNCEDDTQFYYNIRKIVGLRIWKDLWKENVLCLLTYNIKISNNIWKIACMVNRVIEDNPQG